MMSTGTDQEQQRGGLLSFITKDNLKAFLVVNLGLFLLTVGVYFFKIPNNFTTGGVSGLSIILGKVVPFLSTAIAGFRLSVFGKDFWLLDHLLQFDVLL